jgi:tRNA threonylcarbamoyladenosine biosynthesis protein TsaE
LEYLAIRDQLGDETVLLVEWPDRGGRGLPPPDLLLDFGESGGARFIECAGRSERGRALAARVFQDIS